MSSLRHCPVCHNELEAKLFLLDATLQPGVYVEGFACPNMANHGRTVPCSNGCGELVPNPRYHYSYTPGLFGSGRWSCFKPGPRLCHEPALRQPEYPPDPEGVTTIRAQGTVLCMRRLPCPDHRGAS